MKRVYDLIRHRMTLQVICSNCDNTGTLNHRFLGARCGMGMLLSRIDFVCRRCHARRYRLRLVSGHLGERPPLKMQWFGGAYEKFRD
jgi:hypothetical protein